MLSVLAQPLGFAMQFSSWNMRAPGTGTSGDSPVPSRNALGAENCNCHLLELRGASPEMGQQGAPQEFVGILRKKLNINTNH